jgi:prepilin-type N-terminal cleavage/methylation domain-containing protein
MNKKGFTIIELILSTAIIALLVALIMVKITDIKMKNRDTRRMMDIQEISNALNLYQNINNRYPQGDINEMIVALENLDIIPKVPKDPLNSGNYVYTYNSANGSTYTLGFWLETNTIQGYPQGSNSKGP